LGAIVEKQVENAERRETYKKWERCRVLVEMGEGEEGCGIGREHEKQRCLQSTSQTRRN
jgi:hypothetical protein